MTLVIGADEAGYGPNLGPLVVAVTAWDLAQEPHEAAAALDAAVAAAVDAAAGTGAAPSWADSKLVHRGGAGFGALERGALVALAVARGTVPEAWTPLTVAAGVTGSGQRGPPEAAAREALRLPIGNDSAADVATSAAAVRAALVTRGVRGLSIGSAIVDPGAFNAQLDAGLNKSDVLSKATLDLVVRSVRSAEPAVICCDRHGGRKRYAPLLVRHFGSPLVQVDEETAARSAYTLPELAVRIEFRIRAEAAAPVAVASVVAKYVRELAMRAFNEHWGRLAPGLGPTAGYPEDAARWRSGAAAAVGAAGVPWDEIWRRA